MHKMLANAGDSAKRRDLDFYPTPPDVTEALLQFLKPPPSLIWEPACGDGAMSNVLIRHGHTVVSSDLRESGFGKSGIDFLITEPIACDAIVTNPPFNVSSEFIVKALACAPVVAMVLKSQYWHAKKRQTLFNENPPAWVLPLTWRPDFMGGERGGAPTMEVLWTVWLRGDTLTKYKPLPRPINTKACNPFLKKET